jgi:hypothetical protein
MCRDSRTTQQLQGAVTAAAKLASTLTSNPMSTPQERDLADKLHTQIDTELTELDHRRNH